MREPRVVPRRGARPWGAIGTIVLIAAVELLVHRVEDRYFTTNAALSWAFGGRAADRKAAGRDVLCFGDSMVKFGVAPRVLEDRLGAKAYNLALYAGSPTASYFLLRRALEAGARPSAILVDFQPSVLACGPRFHIRLWPELLSVRDAWDLAWTARDADLLASILVARLLPTAKDRHEIRANLRSALRGECYSAIVRDWYAPGPRNWRSNLGSEVAPKNPQFAGNVDAESWLYPAAFTRDPVTAAYVRRFLKLAAARRVPVYWLMPPISPEAQARCDRSGLSDAFTRFAREVQAKFPDVVVIDGRHSDYGHTVFVSPPHLDRQGAATYTDEVADIIARRRSGPELASRWVDLPPFRDRPIAVPLEDFDQSRVALQHLSARRQ
jgi:hypothetical protein